MNIYFIKQSIHRLICKIFGHKESKWIHPQGDNIIVKYKWSRKGGNHKRNTYGKYRYEYKYCTRCGEFIKDRERFIKK